MKYTQIRLVKHDEHIQIRFEGERIDGDKVLETGGVLFDAFLVDGYYVLCKVTNGHPFKICKSIGELIMYLRDKTGLMLKQDIE